MSKDIIISLEVHEAILKKAIRNVIFTTAAIAALLGISIGGSISLLWLNYKVHQKQLHLDTLQAEYNTLAEIQGLR